MQEATQKLTVVREDKDTVIISNSGFSIRVSRSVISGGFHIHPEFNQVFDEMWLPNARKARKVNPKGRTVTIYLKAKQA